MAIFEIQYGNFYSSHTYWKSTHEEGEEHVEWHQPCLYFSQFTSIYMISMQLYSDTTIILYPHLCCCNCLLWNLPESLKIDPSIIAIVYVLHWCSLSSTPHFRHRLYRTTPMMKLHHTLGFYSISNTAPLPHHHIPCTSMSLTVIIYPHKLRSINNTQFFQLS